MNKAYNFRLYPNKENQVLLSKHFGSARFIYNTMLRFKQFYYDKLGINLSNGELSYALTHLKKLEEYSWLNEINSQTLQAALKDLDSAFTNFYQGRANFPKFKSKKTNKFSFRVPQFVKLENNRLYFPKFKKGIKVKQHREIIGTIKNATIKLNPSGKYYVSLIVEYDNQIPAKPKVEYSSAVGIDLGIKTYATLSNKISYTYPMYLENNLVKLKELNMFGPGIILGIVCFTYYIRYFKNISMVTSYVINGIILLLVILYSVAVNKKIFIKILGKFIPKFKERT